MHERRTWSEKAHDAESSLTQQHEEACRALARRLEESRQRWATESAGRAEEWAVAKAELEARHAAATGEETGVAMPASRLVGEPGC